MVSRALPAGQGWEQGRGKERVLEVSLWPHLIPTLALACLPASATMRFQLTTLPFLVTSLRAAAPSSAQSQRILRSFLTKEVRARLANGAAFLYSLTVSSKSSKTYPGVRNGERIANEPSITAAPKMCVNLGQYWENISIQGSKYVAKDLMRNEQQHRVTASDLWYGLSMGFKGCSRRAEIKNDR